MNNNPLFERQFSFKEESTLLITPDIEHIGRIGAMVIDLSKNECMATVGTINLLGIEKQHQQYSFNMIFENIEKDDREKLVSLFDNMMNRNKDFKTDVKVILESDGSKGIVYLQIKSAFDAGPTGQIHKITIILTDVSDRIKVMNDLQKAVNKAEECDKMKSTFISNISHELRTPMNAILGFTELINIGDLSDEKRREYANIIKRKGKSLLTLLDDIAEISKYESGALSIKKIECNVFEILEELFTIYDEKRIQTGKSHVELKLIHPKERIGLMDTDPGRLHQVLSNLLSNALLFTDAGSIEFGVKIHPEKTVQFYVKDTGIGLTKEEQKYLFHRFKNVEEIASKRPGESGLKLTISKAIVELLGGKIWVDSAPNEGSTFYFTIPYILSKVENDELYQKDIGKPYNYNWKDRVILVVEDEEDNYAFIEAILHDTQAQLIHAKHGNQAIELCKSIIKIDLVLMDIKMPQKSGYEAAREILKMRPQLPIIAQTAFSMKEDKEKCLQAGCVDYITKPFDVDVFIEMINTYLPG